MTAGTGHGATLTFPDGANDGPVLSDAAHLIRDMQLFENQGDSADLSHLQSNIFRQYAMVDLYTVGPMRFNVLFRTSVSVERGAGAWSDPLFVPGLRANAVLTFPQRGLGVTPGNVITPATMTGICWLSTRNYGGLESNQEQLASVEVQWETQPTWVAQADATP